MDGDVWFADLVEVPPKLGVILFVLAVLRLAGSSDPVEGGGPIRLDQGWPQVKVGRRIAKRNDGVLVLQRALLMGIGSHGNLQAHSPIKSITRRETTARCGSRSSSHEAWAV